MSQGYIVRGLTDPKLAISFDAPVDVEEVANLRGVQQRKAVGDAGTLSLSDNPVLKGLRGTLNANNIPAPVSHQEARQQARTAADAAAWAEFTATMP